MSETYVRIEPADRDHEELLDPKRQRSEPWDGTIYGRCDKCGGSGRVEHQCESCRAGGPDESCPACHGQVTYEGECPACQGTGEIDDSAREGVSVFPDEDGLYRYMLRRGAEFEGCVVLELAGAPSEDEDFDADEGALLIRPTRILDVRPIDADRLRAVRRDVAADGDAAAA